MEALTGRFDAHHAELARVLLDQVDALTAKIDQLTARAGELIAAMPAAQAPVPVPAGGPGLGSTGTCPVPLPVLERLDEVTGIGLAAAQAIVAEVGLDMAQFPTPARLVSWAKLSPRTVQSGARTSSGNTGKGDPYLRRVLSEAAASAGRTDTFLGERYRRLVRRRGKRGPWWQWRVRSSSSSGTCSTTPRHASPTSGLITTKSVWTRAGAHETSSASYRLLGTRSRSAQQHNPWPFSPLKSGLCPERGSPPHPRWSRAARRVQLPSVDFPSRGYP